MGMEEYDALETAVGGFESEVYYLKNMLFPDPSGLDDSQVAEVRASVNRLQERYLDAENAYFTATVLDMEMEHYEETDQGCSEALEEERSRLSNVIRTYRDGKREMDGLAPVMDEELDIDIWERAKPSTQLYDPDTYLEDMGWDDVDWFDSPVFRVIDTLEGVKDAVYDRFGK